MHPFNLPKAKYFKIFTISAFVITIILFLIRSSYVSSHPNKEVKQRTSHIVDSIMEKIDIDLYGQKITKEGADTLIQLLKVKSSEPNSAGGVDAEITWKNKSKKAVKYLTFHVVAYNAVDDIVMSTIGYDTTRFLKVTGPVSSGAVYGKNTIWENIWYNHTIKHIAVTKIAFEYMDGSKLFLIDVPSIIQPETTTSSRKSKLSHIKDSEEYDDSSNSKIYDEWLKSGKKLTYDEFYENYQHNEYLKSLAPDNVQSRL